MVISQNRMALPDTPQVQRPGTALFIMVAVLASAILLPWKVSLTVVAIAFLLPVLGYIIFELAEGRAELPLQLWVAIFPLGYYFLSYPQHSPIITFDRIIVLLLTLGIVTCPEQVSLPVPRELKICAWCWAVFLMAATISLVKVGQVQSSMRILVDCFLAPGILGWYVLSSFPVIRYLRRLHGIICAAAIYSAAIGLAEIYLGQDLLPIPGAGEYLAGQQQDVALLRVNGPYLSNNSFGLIGLITFCLLWFLGHKLRDGLPRWQRVLHRCAMCAALVQALLPLFRSIFITVAIIVVLDFFRDLSWSQRAVRISALAVMGTAVIAVMIAVPELFEERVSSSENLYGRIAQQKQNLRVFLDDPILGVGLNNFHAVASRKPNVGVSYQSVESLDYPHSNLGAVLAETGIAGFLPYVVSQGLLVWAFWKARRQRTQAARLAWIFFVYIFLSYWISGLALTSGYYSDLNLWYLFALAVVYRCATNDEPEPVAAGPQFTAGSHPLLTPARQGGGTR